MRLALALAPTLTVAMRLTLTPHRSPLTMYTMCTMCIAGRHASLLLIARVAGEA